MADHSTSASSSTSAASASSSVSASAGTLPVVCSLVKRERARALIRTAFPRRRAHVINAKTRDELTTLLGQQLIDAVVLDMGLGEEALRILPMAEDYPSVPFFLITPLLPPDTPLLARAATCGVADVLVEGFDDAAARGVILRRAFTPRFERAMATPPERLGLETALQLGVWRSIVKRGGRPVRTDQLAKELGVSREHLSRSFAVGAAPTLKRVIDLVRVIAAAELAKNPGYDVRDVAQVLGFASSSHLTATTTRLVGARAGSLSRLRTVDLFERFHAPPLGAT